MDNHDPIYDEAWGSHAYYQPGSYVDGRMPSGPSMGRDPRDYMYPEDFRDAVELDQIVQRPRRYRFEDVEYAWPDLYAPNDHKLPRRPIYPPTEDQ